MPPEVDLPGRERPAARDRLVAARASASREQAGMIFVDGVDVGDIEDVALRDRRMLSADGIFIVVATVSEQDGRSVAPPEIIFRGVPFVDEAGRLRRGAARRRRRLAGALGRRRRSARSTCCRTTCTTTWRSSSTSACAAGRWSCRWSSRSRPLAGDRRCPVDSRARRRRCAPESRRRTSLEAECHRVRPWRCRPTRTPGRCPRPACRRQPVEQLGDQRRARRGRDASGRRRCRRGAGLPSSGRAAGPPCRRRRSARRPRVSVSGPWVDERRSARRPPRARRGANVFSDGDRGGAVRAGRRSAPSRGSTRRCPRR